MTRSDMKKKIDASATITNTMIVVIVVSRRVGHVTLAVSERTSCRNLNGLKAIVGYRVLRETIVILAKSEQPSSGPALSRRMSRQAGSIVRGNLKPRRISVLTGQQQVAGIYCQSGKRSRYGVPQGSKWSPFGDPAKKTAGHRLMPGYNLASNAHKPAIWILKASGYPVRSIGERDDHGSVRSRPGKTLG